MIKKICTVVGAVFLVWFILATIKNSMPTTWFEITSKLNSLF